MIRSLVLASVLAVPLTGCGWGKQAEACGRLAKALTVPKLAKSRTSKPGELAEASKAYAEARARVGKLKQLPPELVAIADPAREQLLIAEQALENAAAARRATHAPSYAAARLRVEAARRALTDLSARFEQVCAR